MIYIPAVLSAVTFGSLHIFLRHGPPFRRLKRLFADNQAEISADANPECLVAPVQQRQPRRKRADPETLAAQAEARILNNVHNILQVPLAIIVMRQHAVNSDRAYGTTPQSQLMTTVSAGYFWTDIAIILRNYPQHGPEPLIHAIICVAFFTFAASKSVLHFYGARVLMFELSTPFVHLRWLLHSLHKDRTKMYKVNGLVMMAAFAVCRIAFGTRVILDFWRTSTRVIDGVPVRIKPQHTINPNACRAMRVFGCGIQILNTFWMGKMLQGAFKVFIKKKDA